jgi:hypothetical protein
MSGSVYDPEAFKERVDYAAACLVRGTKSRRFDTCFEMYDGDAVVTALVRRAWKNERLRKSFKGAWAACGLAPSGLPASWEQTAEQYKDIPTKELPDLARRLREAAR